MIYSNNTAKPVQADRLYFDMEFTGLHQKTTLISIGCISNTGKTFYAELTDYDEAQCDDWIKENVIKRLILQNNATRSKEGHVRIVGTKAQVRKSFMEWFDDVYKTPKEPVKVFSDCLAYDWVLFNDLLFDHALKIDKRIYYIPIDLATMFYSAGIDPDISREEFTQVSPDAGETFKHNALWDAKVIKSCVEILEEISRMK